MIRSFADKATAELFRRKMHRKIRPDVQRAALRKLLQLNAAAELADRLDRDVAPPAA